MSLDKLKDYDFGVVSFSEYKKYKNVKNKDWIKSIIVFIFPYSGKIPDESGYLTAKYAYGKDYHQVIKTKLEKLAKSLELEEYEVMTDISFLDEKLCASLAGLGRLGKNNLLLTPKYGSRVLIGEIVTSEEFPETSTDLSNPCLECSLCIKKCPTEALNEGFQKEKCLSFLSQTKGSNYSLYDKMNLVVGCDICQDFCPLNKGENPYFEEFRFDSKSSLTLQDIGGLDDESFRELYQDKAFVFLGYWKLLRNLLMLEANQEKLKPQDLERFASLSDELWFKSHLEYLKGRINNGKD